MKQKKRDSSWERIKEEKNSGNGLLNLKCSAGKNKKKTRRGKTSKKVYQTHRTLEGEKHLPITQIVSPRIELKGF